MAVKRALYFAVFCLFTLLPLAGQFDVTLGYRRATAEINSEVPVAVDKPRQSGFSTALLSKQYPSYRIPVEEIKVYYPDLSGAIDTVGILWYLRPESYSRQGEVNVILVAFSPDSTKTYYIDNNNDRIFADNEEKFVFPADIEKKVLEIKILGNYYNYTLMNPDYAPASGPSRKMADYTNIWRSAARRPSVSFDFSVIAGGGTAGLSFTPTEGSITNYAYQANIFGCLKPAAGVDFSWYNFHITGFAAYERLQYDETILYTYTETGRSRNFDRGSWPTSKLHTGLSAEYDIRLWTLYLTPLASYSTHKILSQEKFDRAVPASPDAEYRNAYTKEAGAKLKIPVASKTVIYLKYLFSTTWFDASDFIPEYTEGSYSLNYKQNYFGIGVLYRLISF